MAVNISSNGAIFADESVSRLYTTAEINETHRRRGRGWVRTVPTTRTRDRDPRGPTGSRMADRWRTLSSATLRSSSAVPSSSGSSGKNTWASRRVVEVYGEDQRDLPLHREGKLIHLSGFRLCININIGECKVGQVGDGSVCTRVYEWVGKAGWEARRRTTTHATLPRAQPLSTHRVERLQID